MQRLFLLTMVLSLSACSGVTVTDVELDGKAVKCHAIEARTSMLNTQGAILCFDTAGNLAGMTGGPGAPAVEIPLVVIDAAGTIIGGALIGKGLSELGNLSVSGAVNHKASLGFDLSNLPVDF